MVDLPEERLSGATTFTQVGMDMFGTLVLSLHALLVGPYTLICEFNGHRLLYHVFEKVYWMQWKCENAEV